MIHISTTIFVPQKINVGFQEREDTYTGKLAYVIYYDQKGKLRKETSWNNWRDHDIPNLEFDNVPTKGFVLNKKVGDYSGSWGNHRQAYCRIYDPRDFEFEITINNLLYILEHCSCSPGKGLDGEFVYAWDGKDLVLLPVESPDYIEIAEYSSRIKNSKQFKGKDLIIGATYLNRNNEEIIYMGRYDCYDYHYGMHIGYGEYQRYSENNGKHYWFLEKKSISESILSFKQRKTLGNYLIDIINSSCDQEYAKYYEEMECDYHFSGFSDKYEIVKMDYETFETMAQQLINKFNSYKYPYSHKFFVDKEKTYYLSYGLFSGQEKPMFCIDEYYYHGKRMYAETIKDAYVLIQPEFVQLYLRNGKKYKGRY